MIKPKFLKKCSRCNSSGNMQINNDVLVIECCNCAHYIAWYGSEIIKMQNYKLLDLMSMWNRGEQNETYFP